MHCLAHVAVFVRVVDAGSFSAAAVQLGMSKPTVSNHITMLERGLGARLLNRTTRSLNLTESGIKFYARCQRILGELEAAEREVVRFSTATGGQLRISAPTPFESGPMVSLLPEFLDLYPEIEIDLEFSDRLVDVIGEGFDLAIRITRNVSSGLRSSRLIPCERIVCAASSYCERHRMPRSLRDLAGHTCLACASSAVGDSWELLGPNGPESVKVSGRLRANNAAVLRAALLSGLGVGLMPTFLIDEDLQAGRLRNLLPGYKDNSYSVFAVYPEHSRLLPKVLAFVEFLQLHYRSAPDRSLPAPPRAASEIKVG